MIPVIPASSLAHDDNSDSDSSFAQSTRDADSRDSDSVMSARYRGENALTRYSQGKTETEKQTSATRFQVWLADMDIFFTPNVAALDIEAAEAHGPPADNADKLLKRDCVKGQLLYSYLDSEIKCQLLPLADSITTYAELLTVLKGRYSVVKIQPIQGLASMQRRAMDRTWSKQDFIDQIKMRGKHKHQT